MESKSSYFKFIERLMIVNNEFLLQYGVVHTLCNIRIFRVHPKLTRTRHGRSSHFHIKETFRIATSTKNKYIFKTVKR